jgi:hypothetical protein
LGKADKDYGLNCIRWTIGIKSAHSRGGLVPFVATKGTKNAFPQQKGFFAAPAFPPQTRQNRGCAYFAGRTWCFETWHAKTLMPCHAQAYIVLPGFGRS